jgi:hypothetical protein
VQGVPLSENLGQSVASGSPVAPGLSVVPTNEIYCMGFTVLAGEATVFLSDGRVGHSSDGEIQQIAKHTVKAFGGTFKVNPRPYAYTTAPDNPLVPSYSVAPSYDPVNDVRILPSINPMELEKPNSSGGFDRMQNNYHANR